MSGLLAALVAGSAEAEPSRLGSLPEAQADPWFTPREVGAACAVQLASVRSAFPYFGIPSNGCGAGRTFAAGRLVAECDGLSSGVRVVLRLDGEPGPAVRRGTTVTVTGLHRAGTGQDGRRVYCASAERVAGTATGAETVNPLDSEPPEQAAGATSTPSAANAQARLLRAGTELAWNDDFIAPPGTHLAYTANPILFGTGIALFVLGYLPGVLLGSGMGITFAASGLASSHATQELLLGLGAATTSLIPFLNGLHTTFAFRFQPPFSNSGLSADGIGAATTALQLAGCGVVVLELLLRKKVLHYDVAGPEPALRTTLVPMSPGAPVGLSLAGTF